MEENRVNELVRSIGHLDETIFRSHSGFDEAADRRRGALHTFLERFVDESVSEPMVVDKEGSTIRAAFVSASSLFELCVAGDGDRRFELRITPLATIDEVRVELTPAQHPQLGLRCLSGGSVKFERRADAGENYGNYDGLLALADILGAHLERAHAAR